jgi:hypothetical protein
MIARDVAGGAKEPSPTKSGKRVEKTEIKSSNVLCSQLVTTYRPGCARNIGIGNFQCSLPKLKFHLKNVEIQDFLVKIS